MNGAGDGNLKRPSFLGPGLVVKGDLVADEELVILGRVSGRRVQAPVITIGPAAEVRADIKTKSIRIEGVVIGDIHAEVSVIVQASATVRGIIHSPVITIREGASINGSASVKPAKQVAGQESLRHKTRATARRA